MEVKFITANFDEILQLILILISKQFLIKPPDRIKENQLLAKLLISRGKLKAQVSVSEQCCEL